MVFNKENVLKAIEPDCKDCWFEQFKDTQPDVCEDNCTKCYEFCERIKEKISKMKEIKNKEIIL